MENSIHLFLVDVWLGFLGLFLTFYVVLDGFDLGIGVLSLFVREQEKRGIMVASLSTVWDANETWLIVLGGALFGAFPVAYGVILHSLYLPIITMIFAFACRGVAFEFRAHARHRRLWDLCFGLGSLVAAVCQGFALGGLISGTPVNNGQFTGGPFYWFSGFSVIVAVGVVFGYSLLGATYLIIKTEGDQQARAVGMAWLAGALMLAAAAAVSIWTPLRFPFIAQKWFGRGVATSFVLPPAFAVFCSVMLARALLMRKEVTPFFWTVGIFLCSLIGLAASFYPYIVPGAVTAGEAAADSFTLVFMMVGIGLLIPIMIFYNGYQYLVFRGKVRDIHYG
jgi:cytochrome bd ubiquinol oxidase subunit II